MKKGFTLIEMLGVVIILSLLVVVGNVAITSITKNAKVELSNVQIELIKESAKRLASDNVSYLPSKNKCKFITLEELYDYDYFNNEVINPANNQAYEDIYVSVCATQSETTNKLLYDYEIKYLDQNKKVEVGMNPFFLAEPDLYNNDLTPIVYVRLTYSDSSHTGTPEREILNGTEVITEVKNTEVYEWQIPYEDDVWYDYPNQMWANAVILDKDVAKSPGKAIDVDLTDGTSDAIGMFVWIPRYSYTLKCQNDDYTNCFGNYEYAERLHALTTPSNTSRGAIDIRFVSKDTKNRSTAKYTGNNVKNWYTMPAFSAISDDETIELDGIWIGKFEISSYDKVLKENINTNLKCYTLDCGMSNTIMTLPNLSALEYNPQRSLFYLIKGISSTYNLSSDTHMVKDSEWTVASTLSQSIYGKYGNMNYTGEYKNVYKNNSYNYVTGNSNANVATYNECYNNDAISILRNLETYYACQSQVNYDYLIDNEDGKGSLGAGASTTGNIYGIYDMVGGSIDYVMFNANNYSSQSMFSSEDLNNMSLKYIDKYNIESGLCNGGSCLGYGFDLVQNQVIFSEEQSFLSRGSTSYLIFKGDINAIGAVFGPGDVSNKGGGQRDSTRVAIFKSIK